MKMKTAVISNNTSMKVMMNTNSISAHEYSPAAIKYRFPLIHFLFPNVNQTKFIPRYYKMYSTLLPKCPVLYIFQLHSPTKLG